MDSERKDSEHFNNHSRRWTAMCRIMDATGNKEMAKKVTEQRSDCVTRFDENRKKQKGEHLKLKLV